MQIPDQKLNYRFQIFLSKSTELDMALVSLEVSSIYSSSNTVQTSTWITQ